jgi:hypothetical protein
MQISKTVVLDETDIGVEVWIELQGDRTWTPHVFTFTSATSTGGPPEQWHELGWLCVGRHEDRDVWGVAEVSVEVNDDVLSALAASYEAVWDGQRRVGSWDPQAREQLEPILERLVVDFYDDRGPCASCGIVVMAEEFGEDGDRCQSCADAPS